MLSSFLIYGCVGAFVGVLAGLLGVGGGLVIVPILVFAFTMQNVSPEIVMHLALLKILMMKTIKRSHYHAFSQIPKK